MRDYWCLSSKSDIAEKYIEWIGEHIGRYWI
jgi:hypothetical protein